MIAGWPSDSCRSLVGLIYRGSNLRARFKASVAGTDQSCRVSKVGADAFLRHEAAGGIVLLAAAVVALLLSNSPLAWAYGALLSTPGSLSIGAFVIEKPLLLWINDGLMAIFFFLVGLAVKRELLVGELSSVRQAILPLIAAVGGMAAPAVIYALINLGNPTGLQGMGNSCCDGHRVRGRCVGIAWLSRTCIAEDFSVGAGDRR